MDTGPPVLPAIEKCDGFGMSIPSTRHTTPSGEFPRITISFLESLAPPTPAKLEAIRAGSEREPAYRSVSETLNCCAEISANSLITAPFFLPETTIASCSMKLSIIGTWTIVSFPEFTSIVTSLVS